MTLRELIAAIVADKELPPCDDTLSCWYLPAVADLEKFLCREATIDDLDRSTVNAWIDCRVREASLSVHTIKTRRGALLAIWNGAVGLEILPDPPAKIRKLRIRPKNPTAWEREEIEQLIRFALHEWQKRYLPKIELPRGLYFGSLAAAGYDTGLRLGDLLSLEREWIRVDGFGEGHLAIVQSKVSRLVGCRLHKETMRLIDELMAHNPGRRLIWPMWGRREALYSQFRKLVRAAGIRDGTFRYLRRASTTHVEIAYPGKGQEHAGHADGGVTRRHYLDAYQLQSTAVCPPPLSYYLS